MLEDNEDIHHVNNHVSNTKVQIQAPATSSFKTLRSSCMKNYSYSGGETEKKNINCYQTKLYRICREMPRG